MKLRVKYKCSECSYKLDRLVQQAVNEKFYSYAYICPSTNHDTGIPLEMEIEVINEATI